MNSTAMTRLGEGLTNLAEVFNARTPSTNALKMWSQSLSGLPDEYIEEALNTWCDYKNKFPTPADFRKYVLEIQEKHYERKCALDAQDTRKAREMTADVSSIVYRAGIAYTRYLAQMKHHSDPRQWAYDIVYEYIEGKDVHPYRLAMAKECLGAFTDGVRDLARSKHKEWLPFKKFLEMEMLTATPEEIQQMGILPSDLPILKEYALN